MSSEGESIVLHRSASTTMTTHQQQQRHRHGAGPQKLLRTVSQKLRSLIKESGSKTGSTSVIMHRPFFKRDPLGECRCKVTPEEQQEQRFLNSSSNISRSSGSKSSNWLFRFSVGREYSHRLQGMSSDELHIDSSDDYQQQPGCFRLNASASWKPRSGSIREDATTNTCTGCFGSFNTVSKPADEDEQAKGLREDSDAEDDLRRLSHQEQTQAVLPDDILEMCLARLPFDSLVRARAVCKKWKALTLTPHFLQLREKYDGQKPWLFLFGLSRHGVCMGEIQALDPTLDKWHTIKAEVLAGRVLYSAVAIGNRIFVVGGCSAQANGDKGGFLRTHRSAFVLDALTGQWSKISSMKQVRTTPVVGVFETKDRVSLFFSSSNNLGKNRNGNNTNSMQNEIGVYRGGSTSVAFTRQFKLMEIMGRHCMQQRHSNSRSEQLWEAYQDLESSSCNNRKSTTRYSAFSGSSSSNRISSNSSSGSSSSSYGLIVVGGQGEWNQTLCSGEIYDPVSDTWKEIAAWPTEFGSICSGAVCKGVFYGYSDTDKVVAYDFEQNSWCGVCVSYVPPRLQDYLPKLLVCGGRLVLLGVAWAGDYEEVKAARKMWMVEEDYEGDGEWKWCEVSQHPDAPLDWNAVFVGHRGRIFGVEMFRMFGQVLDFVTVCSLGVSRPRWDRVSKRRMGQDMDPSSCITKTAVVVQL